MLEPRAEIETTVNKAVTKFDCEAPGLVAAYLSEVIQWNRTLGLVSRKDPLAACERLLLESLELARTLHFQNARIADIGSGAGFPGIVWALNFPRVDITMIERREKRALFLERACRTLPLDNATAVAIDARDAARRPDFKSSFDIVVTMAVGDPSLLADAVEPMLAPSGRFVSTIAGASLSPELIGSHLGLEHRIDGEFGCYVIYRLGV